LCRNIRELRSVNELQAAVQSSRGKALLLTIYSPSCNPCKSTLSRLDTLWESFGQHIDMVKFSVRHQGTYHYSG
jgi:thioredoxin-like negative regulator of GroEL